MDSSNLIPFEYSGHSVRVVEIDDEPWFVAKDVCDVLGVRTDSVPAILEVDEYQKSDPNSIGVQTNAPHGITLVSEPGLYSLILRSRKPEAKQFKRWVIHEVLPQIRKTGSYTAQIPQTYAEALQLAADQARELEAKRTELEAAQPKIEFFDSVTDSKQAVEMKHVAKVLDMGVGRNKLFGILRDHDVLMSDNTPYQEYVDRGYFRVVEQKYTRSDGETRINFKTLVYQRGIEFIRRTLQRELGKTADTMSGVADKMPASTSQHPASFTLQDTVEIVRAGARTKDWE